MVAAPFWVRRPFLVVRDALADRERPDLDRLGRIDDPEAFVWAVLPHAARTKPSCSCTGSPALALSNERS